VPGPEQLQTLGALILDCDGVLTPQDLIYDEEGKRALRFNARDGLAIALLAKHAIKVGVLSGRTIDIAERRMKELGVHTFVGHCRNKFEGVLAMCKEFGVPPQHCAFVGDDLPDLAAFQAAGLRIAVADAAEEVRASADWVTQTKGGHGAVREVGEAILKARGDWQRYLERQQAFGRP
jgi:3-deoxy-D-manno-octulosonate 8-phosphate phosphatase (KDO 8-P phosphatase)